MAHDHVSVRLTTYTMLTYTENAFPFAAIMYETKTKNKKAEVFRRLTPSSKVCASCPAETSGSRRPAPAEGEGELGHLRRVRSELATPGDWLQDERHSRCKDGWRPGRVELSERVGVRVFWWAGGLSGGRPAGRCWKNWLQQRS